MTFENKSFCIVCIANYCRSPVIENLLKNKFPNYEFYSCGISPMHMPSMDPRSFAFLKSLDIDPPIHNPKRINEKMLNYFDYFLAVDLIVLSRLNKLYPKYTHKFRLFTSGVKNIDIIDPYRFDDEKYNEVMLLIVKMMEKINLKEIK